MSLNVQHDNIKLCIINNNLLCTLTNYGYLLYTLNMLQSLKQFNLDKKVFIFCIDNKSYNILSKLGYSAFNIGDNTLMKLSPWNNKGYDKICYLKLVIIYTILSLNINILLIDGDIVFLRNPIDELIKWDNDRYTDVWVQNDSDNDTITVNMCTGYMYIRSTPHMISLYDCISEEGKQKYSISAFDNNDQTFFNKFIKPYCICNSLPIKLYPNGKVFYSNPSLKSSAILIHFNWVHGHLKMAKMKEYGLWILTPEDEEFV
jgi:hypothetical protein